MTESKADTFRKIKERIKAEMARRNGFGSVQTYSSSTYDFTTSPSSGNKIMTEQG